MWAAQTPATSIFLRRFPHHQKPFVSFLIINLLLGVEGIYRFIISTPVAEWDFQTPSIVMLTEHSDFNICSHFRQLCIWERCMKIKTSLLLELHWAVRLAWWIEERVKGQTNLWRFLFICVTFPKLPNNSDFPKYTSSVSKYTGATEEDVKLCRTLWPTWAVLWAIWQI